jgi:hypothetical protein
MVWERALCSGGGGSWLGAPPPPPLAPPAPAPSPSSRRRSRKPTPKASDERPITLCSHSPAPEDFTRKSDIFWYPSSHWRKESDPDPLVRGADPHQNITDPQHCFAGTELLRSSPCILIAVAQRFEPGTYLAAGRRVNQWATPNPKMTYATPRDELRLVQSTHTGIKPKSLEFIML